MADSTTRTAEIKTDKAAELAQRGYFPARGYGRCCLCRQPIHGGQYIGRMPASWMPESKRRHAHHGCVDRLREQVREKAARLGIVVPQPATAGEGAVNG